MIKLGSTQIDKIALGSTELSSVKLGTTEVWANKRKIYKLGTGTTFNVVSFCQSHNIDYTTLTADDFFFTPYTDGSVVLASAGASKDYNCTYGVDCFCEDGVTAKGSSKCGSKGVSTGMSKSYNASTGALTCYYTINANVYILPNSAEAISEGELISVAGNANVATTDPKGYSIATTKNFLYRTLPSSSDYIDCCCSPNCPVAVSWVKNYTQSTGQFYGYFSRIRYGTQYCSGYYFSPKNFTFV